MMQFTFVTQVSAQRDAVASQFDQSLLLKLKPPLVTMRLIQYDGQFRGDELQFAVGFGKFTQTWHGILLCLPITLMFLLRKPQYQRWLSAR